MATRGQDHGADRTADGISEQQRKEFGASLRAARLDAGLKQSDLANMTGIDQKYISKIEHGSVNLTLDTMALLAQALGLDVKVFLAQPPHPKRK